MLKINSEIRAEARTALKGQWGMAVVATLIYITIAGLAGIPYVGIVFSLLVSSVLGYGFVITFLKVIRKEQLDVSNLFDGFHNYFKVLVPMLLVSIYTFLWTLLLIIPGIIKSYSYAMTPYLLHDNPSLDAETLICKSMEMMKGHKMKLFLLDLSFIGWFLLCILTLFIGFLWLHPYVMSAHAAFYEDIRTKTI
jgi:uncharacterized membrane protein